MNDIANCYRDIIQNAAIAAKGAEFYGMNYPEKSFSKALNIGTSDFISSVCGLIAFALDSLDDYLADLDESIAGTGISENLIKVVAMLDKNNFAAAKAKNERPPAA